MKVKTYRTTFKIRRGPLVEWETKNPLLELGEPSFVTDLNKMKIGNGEDLWKDLPYLGGDGEGTLKHSLFIGPHEFNGSEDVVVPVYGGNMMMNSPFMTMSPTTTMTDGLHQCDVSEEP